MKVKIRELPKRYPGQKVIVQLDLFDKRHCKVISSSGLNINSKSSKEDIINYAKIHCIEIDGARPKKEMLNVIRDFEIYKKLKNHYEQQIIDVSKSIGQEVVNESSEEE